MSDRLTERAEVAIHLRINLDNGGFERLDLAQVQQEAMPAGHAPPQGGPQLLGGAFFWMRWT